MVQLLASNLQTCIIIAACDGGGDAEIGLRLESELGNGANINGNNMKKRLRVCHADVGCDLCSWTTYT